MGLEVDGDDGRADAIVVPLPDGARSKPRVTLGVRPEHLRLDGEGDGRIDATVTALEPLGPETLVYFDAGDHRLRARVPGFGGPEVGSEVTLSVDTAHWFDADDGARLSP